MWRKVFPFPSFRGTIQPPIATHCGLPPKAEWSANVAFINVREIVGELKRQRRALDRAIAALEAIGKYHAVRKRKRRGAGSRPSVPEMRNGTTGRVIPFVYEQRRS